MTLILKQYTGEIVSEYQSGPPFLFILILLTEPDSPYSDLGLTCRFVGELVLSIVGNTLR